MVKVVTSGFVTAAGPHLSGAGVTTLSSNGGVSCAGSAPASASPSPSAAAVEAASRPAGGACTCVARTDSVSCSYWITEPVSKRLRASRCRSLRACFRGRVSAAVHFALHIKPLAMQFRGGGGVTPGNDERAALFGHAVRRHGGAAETLVGLFRGERPRIVPAALVEGKLPFVGTKGRSTGG